MGFYQFLWALSSTYLSNSAFRSTVPAMSSNLIHRFHATGAGTPVNAYIIEGRAGTVVVDATLTVSDGRASTNLGRGARQAAAWRDHHARPSRTITAVWWSWSPTSTSRVRDRRRRRVIRRDDPLKEPILRPMFGDEWAAQRAFPNQTVSDGEVVSLDGIALRVTDLGPNESPHDSIWALEDRTATCSRPTSPTTGITVTWRTDSTTVAHKHRPGADELPAE